MAQTSEAGGTIQRRPPLVFSFEIYKISKDVTHLLSLQRSSDIVISRNMKGKPLMAGKTLSEDYPEFKGFNKAYINPHILEIGGEEVSMEEGCLSLPGIHETVKRGNKIRVKYMDEDFVEHEEEVEGYLARVMQHEFDHLDGKMFIDHISALRKQMIKGKLNTMLKGKARSSYKMKQVK